MSISTVGIQGWARRLEQDTRLFSKLTGMVTQRPTMLPHKTLLRPVHPFTGKLPITQTAGNRTLSKLGSSPFVALRKDTTVKDVVIDLSECLRLCHRKNVEWLELTPSRHTEWAFIAPYGALLINVKSHKDGYNMLTITSYLQCCSSFNSCVYVK